MQKSFQFPPSCLTRLCHIPFTITKSDGYPQDFQQNNLSSKSITLECKQFSE